MHKANFNALCVKYAALKMQQRLITPHDKFELPDLRNLLTKLIPSNLAKDRIKRQNAKQGVNALGGEIKALRLATGKRDIQRHDSI